MPLPQGVGHLALRDRTFYPIFVVVAEEKTSATPNKRAASLLHSAAMRSFRRCSTRWRTPCGPEVRKVKAVPGPARCAGFGHGL